MTPTVLLLLILRVITITIAIITTVRAGALDTDVCVTVVESPMATTSHASAVTEHKPTSVAVEAYSTTDRARPISNGTTTIRYVDTRLAHVENVLNRSVSKP